MKFPQRRRHVCALRERGVNMFELDGSQPFGVPAAARTLLVLMVLTLAPPALRAQGKGEISRMFTEHYVKLAVIKPTQFLLKHNYVVPSWTYFQLFDWDMYIMGVALC